MFRVICGHFSSSSKNTMEEIDIKLWQQAASLIILHKGLERNMNWSPSLNALILPKFLTSMSHHLKLCHYAFCVYHLFTH